MNQWTAAGFREEMKFASLLQRGVTGLSNIARRNFHGLTGMGVRDAAHAAQIGLNPSHFSLGLTSVPGTAKALIGHNPQVGAELGRTFRGGGGKLQMAMNALPVAMEAPSLLKGDESAQGGRSMTGKLVGLGANLGLGLASGGLPIGTNVLTGIAAAPMINAATRYL